MNDPERDVAAAIVDGYRRIPQETSDAWGNLAKEADINTLELMKRLDDEERAAGDPRW